MERKNSNFIVKNPGKHHPSLGDQGWHHQLLSHVDLMCPLILCDEQIFLLKIYNPNYELMGILKYTFP